MKMKEHWEQVYSSKSSNEVSWYADHLDLSIATIDSLGGTDAKIIDVGGGASTLVDDLLAHGYRDVSVLEISAAAVNTARERIGQTAEAVTWIVGDVTKVELSEGAYDIWHDRAAFHFLTDPADRRSYVDLAGRSLRAGGHAIIATFALDGPTRCSGLEVQRYDAQTLAMELGPGFQFREETSLTHQTPSGQEQKFLQCLFQKG